MTAAATGRQDTIHGEQSPLLEACLSISEEESLESKDATVEADETGQASFVHTVLNLMKTCMGTGCLALSYACQQGGLLVFLIGIVAIMIWNVVAVQRLVLCAHYLPTDDMNDDDDHRPVNKRRIDEEEQSDNHENTTISTSARINDLKVISHAPPQGTSKLGQVAWYAFGPVGLAVLDVMMLLLLNGVIIAYVAGAISFLGDTPITLGPWVDAIIVGTIMGSLSLVPDLGHLARASAMGLVVLLATFLVIASYGILDWKHSPHVLQPSISLMPRDGLTGLSEWFGVVVFGFGVVPLTFNFRDSMKQPAKIVAAMGVALTGVSISYIIMGAGMLFLFPALTGDVLHELPKTGWLPILTRLAMVWVVATTAPLLIVICGELIEGKWQTASHLRSVVRFGICGVAVLVAVVLPSFVQILSLVGSACVGTVGFCLPPLFHLKLSTAHLLDQQQHFHHSPVDLKQSSGSSTYKPSKRRQHRTCRPLLCSASFWFDVVLLTWGILATIISTGCMFRELARNPSATTTYH